MIAVRQPIHRLPFDTTVGQYLPAVLLLTNSGLRISLRYTELENQNGGKRLEVHIRMQSNNIFRGAGLHH
jgi:hypothetical protein